MKGDHAPVPVICFGDSLTEGNPHAEADKWPTRFQSLLDQSHPGNYKVYNRGVAGNTSAQALDRVEETVLPLLPGYVIIGFGINDCNVRVGRRTPRVGAGEFASNLRELIRLLLAADGRPVLLASHHPEPDLRAADSRRYDQGNGRSYADNFRPYRQAIQWTAQAGKTSLIDMPALMVDSGVNASDLVMEDGLHLTASGNFFYAEQIHRHFALAATTRLTTKANEVPNDVTEVSGSELFSRRQ